MTASDACNARPVDEGTLRSASTASESPGVLDVPALAPTRLEGGSPPVASSPDSIVASSLDPIVASRPDTALAKSPWILHIGDSFTHAFFQQNLGPRFRAAGARYVVDATTSTFTTTWARSTDLDRWLTRRPSLVLVTLGANEFSLPFPAARAGAIETIARKIAASGASCVWISPPMWTRETGILEVIYDHCAPCVFVDSDAILGGDGLSRAERNPDGIHPNPQGGSRWATAFWEWLMDHRDPTRQPWAVERYERRLSW